MKSPITYLKKLELFKELDNYRDGQFFAVADQRIKNHLPQWIQFSSQVFWLKNPEEEKNLDSYGRAVEFLLTQGIQRKSVIHAFGGGATTDLTGFIASTILRGVSWVSVPTTLLGMIDGSIGGKVAVNMPQGKNLVGAFHAPEKVLICGDFLTTLTDKEWLSGKGEMLKYGFLSKDIHDLIIKKAPVEDIAVECAKFKMLVVENDFLDEAGRIFLNLGHTFGHAFESTLKIPHGQAIAMGLKYLFKVMKQESALTHWENMVRSMAIPMEKFDLSLFPNFDLKDFFSYLEQDKKKIDAKIRLILVKSIGACYIEEINLKDLKAKIQDHEDFKS
ncbi:MAG TPA: 3-dehydroquinate synthase family protein [Bacteriovoracaceae bacterium]|nr:3-dehydroquinate synthase family protein [Bacteriovoracaceae bacterium]